MILDQGVPNNPKPRSSAKALPKLVKKPSTKTCFGRWNAPSQFFLQFFIYNFLGRFCEEPFSKKIVNKFL